MVEAGDGAQMYLLHQWSCVCRPTFVCSSWEVMVLIEKIKAVDLLAQSKGCIEVPEASAGRRAPCSAINNQLMGAAVASGAICATQVPPCEPPPPSPFAWCGSRVPRMCRPSAGARGGEKENNENPRSFATSTSSAACQSALTALECKCGRLRASDCSGCECE